ncbi:RNA helicase, partial [Bacillus cereus]|nr:RNA helicase [Bacillus cereus]
MVYLKNVLELRISETINQTITQNGISEAKTNHQNEIQLNMSVNDNIS